MYRFTLFLLSLCLLTVHTEGQGSEGLSPQKQVKLHTQSIKKLQKDISGVQRDLQRVRVSFDTLKNEGTKLSGNIVENLGELGDKIERNNLSVGKMADRLSVLSDERLSGLESRTRRYFIAAFILFFSAFGFLLYKFVGITKKLDATEQLMHETLRLETKMSELLENHQTLTDEVKKTTGIYTSQGFGSKEDHSFFITVSEELFRMRSRLSKIPQDTKGWVALTNALSRIENELNLKGYRISDLTGQPYFDEMTALVKEFVPQDDLPVGEQKVLRMIRPQIKHNEKIVSHGEIEVAMSVEDLAQK